MARFGDSFIMISKSWAGLKAICASKRAPLQCDDLGDLYELFAVDGPLVYLTTIWKDAVPAGVLESYSQVQNDADRAEYESAYAATANAPLVHRLSTGLPTAAQVEVPAGASPYRRSWDVAAAPESVAVLDIWVGGKLVGPLGICLLVGGHYSVRTNAAVGSAVHFALVDRDDVLGAFSPYGLQRARLSGLTGTTGTIAVGDTVTGGTSTRKARVLAVGADYVEVTYNEGQFTDGEALAFAPSGAASTLGTWDEGDVFEIERFVEDEHVEGYDSGDDGNTGGALPVPSGLYFRVIVYNAHTTDTMRLTVRLKVARR